MHKSSPNAQLESHSSLRSNYKKTLLPNGIRIVTEEIPYVRSVSIGIWVDVGSRDEIASSNGISHFVEHMVFKGTKRFSSQQIARSLEEVGGYLNAFTTKEQTCFYARILDSSLENALDVISDMVQYPLFQEKDIEKEKTVILEELKNIEDDPNDLIHDYFDQSVYFNHPLSRPIIGNSETILSFTKESAEEYLRAHYIPERMVVAAAGNVTHDAVVRLVDHHFRSGNRRRTHLVKRAVGPKKVHPSKNVYRKPINQAHVCLGTLGYGVKNPLRFPLLVLNTLLGEGMSSRLFQNIREKYGFAYSVYSFANMMSDTGNFGVYVATDDKNIENSIGLIRKELDKVREKPVGKSELKRAKAQLKGSMMLSLESMSNRMMRLGSGEIFYGNYTQLDEILKKIEAVTIDDILAVANPLLKEEKFSTVIIQPGPREQNDVSTAA